MLKLAIRQSGPKASRKYHPAVLYGNNHAALVGDPEDTPEEAAELLSEILEGAWELTDEVADLLPAREDPEEVESPSPSEPRLVEYQGREVTVEWLIDQLDWHKRTYS